MEREVTLAQILEARERRAARQAEWLAAHGGALISFTMNIAGPVKDSPLIRRAFGAGCKQLDASLKSAGIPVVRRADFLSDTGCEALYAVMGEALAVKLVCTAIEDASYLGRLFDMDVLDGSGQKLDRAAVGGGERGCIVCGAAGRGCASRRLHSYGEVQAATRRMMETHFAAADRETIAALATAALEDEVETTPKPGLVDRDNTGSHRDMDMATFRASIAALAPYWARCAEIGQRTAGEGPEETFRQLRPAGRAAEEAMYAATGGINTHKGAIFTLGAVCGAVGRLWRAEAPCREPERIAAQCAELYGAAFKRDMAALEGRDPAHLTAGERLYLRYGLTGIRGELAAGLPGVIGVALPTFEGALAAGRSRNDAGVIALLHLIARGTDTNMISRGGLALAGEATDQARDLLRRASLPDMAEVAALDRWFIRNNLSPGGCADLLAVTYLLHDWQHEEI